MTGYIMKYKLEIAFYTWFEWSYIPLAGSKQMPSPCFIMRAVLSEYIPRLSLSGKSEFFFQVSEKSGSL